MVIAPLAGHLRRASVAKSIAHSAEFLAFVMRPAALSAKVDGLWIGLVGDLESLIVPRPRIAVMPMGPFLIFDKSSLESLNLDEAVMLDNFYMSNITPLFFVECLADLEKAIRSQSTPEQLVGSLAARTPESQSYPNLHHATILRSELAGHFDVSFR